MNNIGIGCFGLVVFPITVFTVALVIGILSDNAFMGILGGMSVIFIYLFVDVALEYCALRRIMKGKDE